MMKKAKLINNNDFTKDEIWQLLFDALMIHFKGHNATMLEVFDTSFNYELTTKNDDFIIYHVEYTISPSGGLDIFWSEAEQIENL
jgi:hypothetical protein